MTNINKDNNYNLKEHSSYQDIQIGEDLKLLNEIVCDDYIYENNSISYIEDIFLILYKE